MFLNPDGTLNTEAMVKAAAQSGGSQLPDGEYVCRLLSAELQEAKGENKQPLPGKKRLSAKFTIMRGEYEKQELFLSYNLFLNQKSDGSGPAVGSTSGTVRFLADLAAIGKPYAAGKGVKLGLDSHGNMGVFTSNGVSVEALKKFWMERVAKETIVIASRTETSQDRKTGRDFSFSVRTFVGLYAALQEEETGETETPEQEYNPDEEIPF